MPDRPASFVDVLTALLDHGHLAHAGDLGRIAARAAAPVGWEVQVYLADYEQRALVRLDPTAGPREDIPIAGTLAGRAFERIEPLVSSDGQIWVPMMDSVERLGVLSIRPGAGATWEDPQLRSELRWFAQLLGHLIAAKSPYGDTLHRLRSNRPRTLAAEVLWTILPPLTFGCEGLVVSCLMEPCHEVAGDAFDYAVADGLAHLAIFDSVGHDLSSGLSATVILGAYRNHRRYGAGGLTERAGAIDRVLEDHIQPHSYATGVIAELTLATGRLRYVNAGHPAPLLLRRGKVVRSLEGRRPLFGLPGTSQGPAEEQLEPDDQLVLYTDGIVEARDEAGAFFGLDRLVDIIERGAATGLPAPETLRRVGRAVMDHQRRRLQDDATILIAQWASGREHRLRSA